MNRLKIAAASAAALFLAACATTQLDAQWTNPEYRGGSFRGASVLVACEAPDLTLQRICEDQVAAQVASLGGVPTRASQATATGGPAAGNDPYVATARRIGARVIVRTTVSPGAAVASQAGPTIGIGIGGGSGSIGGAGGISFPVGGTRVSTAYTSETTLIDPANGVIIWSARATSSTAQDSGGQIAELAKTTGAALKQSALF
jgi:hypothetical protein